VGSYCYINPMTTSTSQFDLTGKTVVITGGAGFLGAHFSEALGQAGAYIVITDINLEAAEKAVAALASDATAVVMDVTKKESIAEAIQKIVAERGGIDVLINNAAIDPKFDPGADQNDKSFENYPEELLRLSLDVNLLGYVLVAQEVVKQMLKQKHGNIINISSIYGITGPDQRIYPNGTQKPVDYAITKGGVVMLTKWLATTYGRDGIRANTYTLGGVFKGHDDDFVKKYGDHTAYGRMVLPEEVGAPLVFLASEASAGMTGHNLRVDGGWTV